MRTHARRSAAAGRARAARAVFERRRRHCSGRGAVRWRLGASLATTGSCDRAGVRPRHAVSRPRAPRRRPRSLAQRAGAFRDALGEGRRAGAPLSRGGCPSRPSHLAARRALLEYGARAAAAERGVRLRCVAASRVQSRRRRLPGKQHASLLLCSAPPARASAARAAALRRLHRARRTRRHAMRHACASRRHPFAPRLRVGFACRCSPQPPGPLAAPARFASQRRRRWR